MSVCSAQISSTHEEMPGMQVLVCNYTDRRQRQTDPENWLVTRPSQKR